MKIKSLFSYFLIFLFLTTAIGGAYAVGRINAPTATADDLKLDEQEATIRAINKVIPAVVSIIVYDYEEFQVYGQIAGPSVELQRKKVTSGTGFLISSDGLILTNKHVANAASKERGEYRVILNSGKEYYAQVIGTDPLNDLAVIKIFDKDLPVVELGSSDKLAQGMSVIAIGNTLGRFQNSVTKGIISGLGRSLYAGDPNGQGQNFDNVIQTDANINQGNSGGPLVTLDGKVVGINSAVDAAGTAVGFAIPINDARQVIQSVKTVGRIVRPMLGVRYQMVTPELAGDLKLPRQDGALLADTTDSPAIVPGSPAQKAGLKVGDIVYEINAIPLKGGTTLISLIQRYKPGDRIGLKVQRGQEHLVVVVTLGDFRDAGN